MQNKTTLSAKAVKMKRPVAAGLQGEGLPARRPLCTNGGGLHPHERIKQRPQSFAEAAAAATGGMTPYSARSICCIPSFE